MALSRDPGLGYEDEGVFRGEGMPRKLMPLCGLAAALAAHAPARAQEAAIDPATIALPNLVFTPNEGTIRDYGKYFYFHRDDTDFATAMADLRECDGYSRNLSFRNAGTYANVPYPYAGTMAGALGGALGNALGASIADATRGAAERRRIRRINLRSCMSFKGYHAYGLPRSLWQDFNFEEGNARIPESRRQRFLQIQARVASGPRPTLGELVE